MNDLSKKNIGGERLFVFLLQNAAREKSLHLEYVE